MPGPTNEKDREKKVLSLSPRGKLELKKGGESKQVRQSFSHGRSKAVAVEVKKLRADKGSPSGGRGVRTLSSDEKEARLKALKGVLADKARRDAAEQVVPKLGSEVPPEIGINGDSAPVKAAAKQPADAPASEARADTAVPVSVITDAAPLADAPHAGPISVKRVTDPAERRRLEEEERLEIEREEARVRDAQVNTQRGSEKATKRAAAPSPSDPAPASEAVEVVVRTAVSAPRPKPSAAARLGSAGIAEGPASGRPTGRGRADEGDDARNSRRTPGKAAPGGRGRAEGERRRGKLTVSSAVNDEGDGRMRSLAAQRRAKEKERRQMSGKMAGAAKQVREVQLPDAITVQELANRMAERGGDVVKALMRNGVMATINQTLDAETAELIIQEFGHKVNRVSDSDVELVLDTKQDEQENQLPRPPVVTIMGHVDHGKTSLLDALRQTDVAAGEAGGITQHIGAYQVHLADGGRITFIDTPGHAAFSQMRARGANITDVVVLVVAANDGVMPQTIEAIKHAKAANVPMIVAINKIDLSEADTNKVQVELLQHEIVTEDMGGEILAVGVSAKTREGLDKLEEAIQLQAEILELKANPNRAAEGHVIEAKVERGRGSVATVLVRRGTLRVGDTFVVGSEFGRVRAMLDDRGRQVKAAEPGMPVEDLGLNGIPNAGDDLNTVDSENQAREIAEYRSKKSREASAAANARSSLEQMFKSIEQGSAKALPIVVKGDVQGSIEAITSALDKLAGDNTEVRAQVLYGGVGSITESDITLAGASNALIIGFNVRANPQARELAKREGVEIRYYSVIYHVLDDVKSALAGMLAPKYEQQFLGYAQIRQVFDISKVGRVAGCMITEGVVKRGSGVRLLRDNVVIHEGTLKTLKRFKDEVREVREGFECGMAFENYDDIRDGDMIECYEMKEIAQVL
jgi:translation initiation factor IF-2